MTERTDHSDEQKWQSMTSDEAVEHLKSWIDNIDDPNELARLLGAVCGCEGTGYSGADGRIYFRIAM